MMHAEIGNLFDLTGRVALVIGGSANLGFDAASVLAAAGCDVAITSRDKDRARESAEKLRRQYGVDSFSQALDQTAHAQVEQMARAVQSWKGHIDILVNNAGGGSGNTPALLFERAPVDIDRLLAVNVNGLLYCCREVGKIMAAKGRGKIVNIASIAGLVGRDRRMYEGTGMRGQPVDYAAAKAALIGMTRDLAGYLSPMGVCVNAISPGGFERGQPAEFVRRYSDRTPLGRMGHDGSDLKGAVLFLSSPASDYVTGHNLVVDGGFSIWQ
jgi:NAD(P)-dependent dehydrogenase (short-subunit alcohol dehydrogenase family)